MAVVLPVSFSVLEAAGAQVIIPARIIGAGHPTPGTPPDNEVDTMLGNATWCWSRLAQRRAAEWCGVHDDPTTGALGELEETTLLAAAPAIPLLPVGPTARGVLCLEVAATLALGRDSAASQLYAELDGQDAHVNLLVTDDTGLILGGSTYAALGPGRGAVGVLLGTVGATVGRNLRLLVYLAADPAWASPAILYGVRVVEREVPVGDL